MLSLKDAMQEILSGNRAIAPKAGAFVSVLLIGSFRHVRYLAALGIANTYYRNPKGTNR
jgi:hypothetical protein